MTLAVPAIVTAQTNQIFVPNMGQILSTDSTTIARSYYANVPGGVVYLSEDTVSFVHVKVDTTIAEVDTLYRFDMRFM